MCDMKWHYFINANGSATSATINGVITTLHDNFVRIEAYACRESKTQHECAAQMAQREALLHVIGNTNATQLAGVCDQENALASFNALTARARVMDLKPLSDTPRPLWTIVAKVTITLVVDSCVVVVVITLREASMIAVASAVVADIVADIVVDIAVDTAEGIKLDTVVVTEGITMLGIPGTFFVKVCFNCVGRNHLAEMCSSPPSKSQLKYLAKKAARGPGGNGGQGSNNNATA
ncbi:hypothetical protein HDU93_004552 [Gonapodya sp. JEL0774]|nr:hypothetical protein HDU93_004552 [Gonapodya sp. JEL0774]